MTRRFAIAAASAAVLLASAAVFLFRYPTAHDTLPTGTPRRQSIVIDFAKNSPQEYMEGIYAAGQEVVAPETARIRGVIVPHHLTATAAIASGIAMLAHQRFAKILLISPDHFRQCPTVLCTADTEFHTPLGDATADAMTLDTLRASPLVTDLPALFNHEHGISAVVPYLAQAFPGVPVTPVVMSQFEPWKNRGNDLVALVNSAATDDTIIVVSSDFSHYLPLADAEKKDELTAQAIFSADLDAIADLKNPSQSDCPNCLFVLASLAEHRGFYNPSVVRHTNSATLLGDLRAKETTSHFAMVWYANDPVGSDAPAFAGDVTLTRGFPPPLPKKAAAWWAGTGLRVVNLEGPLARHCPPQKHPYLFCNLIADWQNISTLATHWGTRNNHMFDRGAAGVSATEQAISDGKELPLTETTWSDGDVRIFAITSVLNPVPVPPGEVQKETAAVITALSETPEPKKLNVVFIHGGEEYHALTTTAHATFLRGFIEAGADAVIETHSHIPGDVELYRGKPIFRGLGNFLFDQTTKSTTATRKMVRLKKTGDTVLFSTFIGRE